MADNVSDALKNLDKQIKNADQSLSTMMQRYERFQRAASTGDATKMQQAWNSLQTGANTTAAKLRTLEKEIKNLKAQTKDSDSLQRLDKLFRQLNAASGAWASVLASVNRGQQTTQVFAERLARAFDKGQRALAAFNNEQVRGAAASNKMKQDLAGLLPILQKLGYAFGITFSLQGIVQFGKKLVETRGEFEMQFVAMKQIIGDVDAATKIWNQTMQQALQSPFKAMQLVDYTKKLAAYRIETEKLFDTMKRLADISAGLGVDMGRLILAYGQVKAANYLRASEVRQFTEAGVNIYSELAKYFTELEGRAVGTAEVVERVTKRMVLFSDVEKIFQRMTDEGGAFFNMQEVQADTVRGQIMKLHDAYDQMLNTIGQANQGPIRDLIDSLNSLVRNWQNVAYVLKWNVNWVTLFGGALVLLSNNYLKGATKQTLWFGKAILGNSKALLSATKDVKIFSRVIGDYTLKQRVAIVATRTLQGAVGALGHAFRIAWPFLVFEGVVIALERITRSTRELKRMQEEMAGVAAENTSRMQKEISEYDSLVKKLKQTNEGTMARKEVLDEISQKYGKYLDFIITEKTSVEDLAGAYDKVVSSIRNYTAEKIRDEQQQQVEKGMYDEYQDLVNSLADARIWDTEGVMSKITKAQAQNIAKVVQQSLEKYGSADIQKILETYFGEQYSFSFAGDNQGVRNTISSYISDWQELKRELDGIRDETEGITPVFASDEEYKQYKKNLEDANAELVKQQKIYEEQVNSKKEEKRNADEQWKLDDALAELRIKNEEKVLEIKKKYGLLTEQQYKDEMARLRGQLDSYETDYNNRLANALSAEFGTTWKTANKDARDMYNYVVSTEDALQQGTQQRNKQLKESYSGLKESLKQYQAALDAGGDKESLDKNITWTKLMMKAIELAAQLRGIDLSDKKTSSTPRNYKSVSTLISLLREMNSEYEKLSESAYGFAKSQKKVEESFGPAFKEIFGFAGIKMSDVDFTSKAGTANAMKLAIDTLDAKKMWGKFGSDGGKKARQEFLKAWGQMQADVDINIANKAREDFGRQMEQMFNDYELTLEIQGLNIPKEAMNDLFPDVDVTTLGKLQDQIQKFYQDRQTKDEKGNVLFSEKDLETYRKWADKVDAEILKARKERAKQYSKYLEKEYSERAKLEMQYARDVAFIKANITDDTQRENILSNVQKKYQNDLNELNWKSFKESDFYVEMMDDLASLPRDYMQMMLNKIEEILQHPETLSPRALKEAINARQKVLEAQMNIEPLDVMRTSLATINQAKNDVGGTSWKDTKDKIHEQIASTQQEIDALEEEARRWDATAAAMQVYEDAAEAVVTARGKLSTETQGMVEQQGSANAVAEYQTKITDANAKISELEGKESLTTQEQDQLNALRATVEYYEQQVALLNELITKEQELAAVRTLQAGTDAEQQRVEGGVGTASAARGKAQGARDQANQPKQKIQNLKQYLEAFTNFDAAFAKFNAAINSTLNAVAGMGNAFYDMFDALGGKTDALTEGWKEFGNTMISSITNALTMIPMMVAAFTAAGIAINSAMGIIGLIAEALNLLMTAITAISKLHDAQYEKEIENQQKKIDELKSAYERLEKAIEKTWTTMTYIDTYNQQVENIKQQIEAIEAQRNAENAKKNTDEDKIKEYSDAIQEAYDELEELEQKRIEVFGGLGEVNYRSAAEEFVSAWKDAFLETGDGLEALQEHFDEFLQEWFVKQATMRIAGAMLERTFRMIDDSVNESSEGGVAVTMAELQSIRDEFASQAPLISEALEELAGMWDLGNGDGSLSGLAAGIQGMTEEQANILEAYWNSVRMYTANIDGNVERIANILGAGGSAVNPQLQQLQTIAQNTQAIHTLLEGVTKSGHPEGGRGIKVFNN